MQELRLLAVSEDGTYAVLAVPGRGGRFSLPIDDRLRTVARGHFSRLAQYEIEVENPLRPKEIQDRIRAGETADEIADAAGIPIERIRRFEGPVLAEREYRAQEAQRSTVRGHTESGPGPRLGDIVLERLADAGSSPDAQSWDSRKRADGNWQVQLQFILDGRPQIAEWVFDPRRRHVIPADDFARRLSLPQIDWPAGGLGTLGTPTATVTPIGTRLGAHQADPRSDPDRGLARGAGPAPASRPYQPGAYQPAEPPRPREAAHARESGHSHEAARLAQAELDVVTAAASSSAASHGSGAPAGRAAAQTAPAQAGSARAPSAPAASAPTAAPGRQPTAGGATTGRATRDGGTADRAPTPPSAAASAAPPASRGPVPAGRPGSGQPGTASSGTASGTASSGPTSPGGAASGGRPSGAAASGAPASAGRAEDGQSAAEDGRPATAPEPRAPARPGRKAAGGKGRRSSVPSWDEIMLGNSRQAD